MTELTGHCPACNALRIVLDNGRCAECDFQIRPRLFLDDVEIPVLTVDLPLSFCDGSATAGSVKHLGQILDRHLHAYRNGLPPPDPE